MHIDIVPNRNSKPAVLLRESFRDAKSKKPRKRTIANLSKLPSEQVDSIRRVLKGEKTRRGRGRLRGCARRFATPRWRRGRVERDETP